MTPSLVTSEHHGESAVMDEAPSVSREHGASIEAPVIHSFMSPENQEHCVDALLSPHASADTEFQQSASIDAHGNHDAAVVVETSSVSSQSSVSSEEQNEEEETKQEQMAIEQVFSSPAEVQIE